MAWLITNIGAVLAIHSDRLEPSLCFFLLSTRLPKKLFTGQGAENATFRNVNYFKGDAKIYRADSGKSRA
ncbi:hypothetical protein ABE67_18795 [Cytobacillus firmus]|nr:hypothetical protein [Cytobacillus firmus]